VTWDRVTISLVQVRNRDRLSLIVINVRNFSRMQKNFYVGCSHVWYFKYKLRHTSRTIFHIIRPISFTLPSYKLHTPLVTHTKEDIRNQPLHYYSQHVQRQAYYNVRLLATSQHVTRGDCHCPSRSRSSVIFTIPKQLPQQVHKFHASCIAFQKFILKFRSNEVKNLVKSFSSAE